MTTFLIVQLKCFLEGNSRVDAKFKDDLLNGTSHKALQLLDLSRKFHFYFVLTYFIKCTATFGGL